MWVYEGDLLKTDGDWYDRLIPLLLPFKITWNGSSGEDIDYSQETRECAHFFFSFRHAQPLTHRLKKGHIAVEGGSGSLFDRQVMRLPVAQFTVGCFQISQRNRGFRLEGLKMEKNVFKMAFCRRSRDPRTRRGPLRLSSSRPL